ncbi:MAG: glycine-rich domain-containing protein [Ilumatobacteraceae bacterium]
MRSGNGLDVAADTSFTIQVGAGGAGAPIPGATSTRGSSGGASRITGSSSGVLASVLGGGGGGTGANKLPDNPGHRGADGGSGGGSQALLYGGDPDDPVGLGEAGEGSSGGAGAGGGVTHDTGTAWVAGGGGGADGAGGGAGETEEEVSAGNGGDGGAVSWITESIATALGIGEVDGSDVYFAGGGAGAGDETVTYTLGTGGLGGGGDGRFHAGDAAAQNGAASTGGGGAGSSLTAGGDTRVGGAGGSGVVVLRYRQPAYSLTYNANGGSGTVPNDTVGALPLTVASGNALTSGSLAFLRWNTSSDGSGTDFEPGSSYSSGADLQLFAIYEYDPSLSWAPTTSVALPQSPLTPITAPTFTGDGALTYSVLTPGTTECSVDPSTGVLTFTAVGSCTVRAFLAANGDMAADSIDVTFVIDKATQEPLIFTSASTAVWGDTLTATVSGGSGTGSLTFDATSGSAGCTINTTTGAIAYTSVGTCTITATKAGDANHHAAQQTQTLTIDAARDTITLPAPPVPSAVTTPGDEPTCPCVFDADGSPIVIDIERAPPGTTPGSIAVTDGTSAITIGGDSPDSADDSMWVDADGHLVLRPPTAMPFSGSGGLPGTTVTVVIDGIGVGTAIVNPDGTWQSVVDLPADSTGPIDATIAWVDADGNQTSMVLPVGIYAPISTPPNLTIDDPAECPCVFDTDENLVAVSIDRTPTGIMPGAITIVDGSSTITVAGGSSEVHANSWIDATGDVALQTPGTLPLAGDNALPGTTVTVFIRGAAVATAIVDPDGMWALDLDLPAGTNGPISSIIVWADSTARHRRIALPVTVIATGDAATAPRSPSSGTPLVLAPGTAVGIGPDGELIDAIRIADSMTNTVTVTAGDTGLTVAPTQNGRIGSTGRLVLSHPSRVRVTGDNMLPGTAATVWIMSDPQQLGTVTVSAKGTIDATFAIPTDVDPGDHTIQIDGTDADGHALSIALSLTIVTDVLPVTGTSTDTHLAWLTLMLALGALTTLTAHRHRRRCSESR